MASTDPWSKLVLDLSALLSPSSLHYFFSLGFYTFSQQYFSLESLSTRVATIPLLFMLVLHVFSHLELNSNFLHPAEMGNHSCAAERQEGLLITCMHS